MCGKLWRKKQWIQKTLGSHIERALLSQQVYNPDAKKLKQYLWPLFTRGNGHFARTCWRNLIKQNKSIKYLVLTCFSGVSVTSCSLCFSSKGKNGEVPWKRRERREFENTYLFKTLYFVISFICVCAHAFAFLSLPFYTVVWVLFA